MKLSTATTYTIVLGLSAYVQAFAVPVSSESLVSRSTKQNEIHALDTNLHLQRRQFPDSADLQKRGSSAGRSSRDRNGSQKSSKKTRLCRRGQLCGKERKKGKQPAIELGGISSADQPEGSRQPSSASESPPQLYLDRATIKTRLNTISARFAEKNEGETMSGVVIGSAAGTVLSRKGRDAQDLDIISSGEGTSANVGFWEAAEWATKANKWHRDWANKAPQTGTHLSKNQIKRIERRAREQNQFVYEGNRVELLAAPWDYQVASKITRRTGPNFKPTDIGDIAVDLRQMFAAERIKTISATDIQGRLEYYGLTKSGDTSFKSVLERINKKYKKEYNVDVDVITGVGKL